LEEREMEHQSAGSSRLVCALTVAALFLLLPFAAVPPAYALSEDLEDTFASPGSRTMRVGWPGLVDDLQTLNPLLAVRDAEIFVTKVTYSTLLTRDVRNEFVGDLATKCEVLPDLMTWHIEIVETAGFYDKNVPGEQRPLTTADVMFTYWLVQNNSDINQPYAFPELPSAGGSLIESMWANGDFEMWIKLRIPYAPFLNAISVIPILPKYIWETKNWNWQNYNGTCPPCVGSGPWYYGLDGPPDGYSVVLYENPEWFATEEYGWQLHVDTLVLRSESEDSNLMNYLSLGSDVMTRITPAQYIGGGLGGTKWQSSQGFVFEFNMNQLTEENRDLYDIPGPTSYNNQLLLDPVVKLALQMSVDKDEFVTDVLYGLGKPADTLMPEVSPWRYDYGGVDAPPGEEEISFDPVAARMMLYDNGWRYRLTGTEILPEDPDYCTYYPLSRSGVTDTLHFRYITPNTQSYFAAGAQLIRQDAASTGISLVLSVEPIMVMNSAWGTADYDTWLWHWEFTPTSEPSVDVMHHLTTDAIGVWSDVYWSNASYDALYNNSILAVDPGVRKLVLDEMQRMAYLHSGCWPVAWMDSLYAAQSVSPDFWQNFGNWTESYPLVIDSGYPWLFTQVYPLDNPAPQIVNWIECYEGLTTTPIPFDATVVDEGPPSALEYMWNFGDGTKSPWMSSASIEHLYSEDGYYDVWLIVKEMDTLDGFISSEKATVCITGTNTAPHGLAFTYEPSDPDNGTLIHFNGTAVDDDGDPLVYSWDFGDGSTAQGQNVTHQFIVGSQTYTVTMYVDDGHVSHPGGVRPASTTRLVTVTENTAPTIVVQDEPFVQKNVPFLFRAYAYDPDVRDTLRFTWDWGDLSDPSVTTTDTAWHTYSRGTYTLTVWCDDLTGLDGHNQSDTAIIMVAPTPNYAPVIEAFYVSNEMPAVEETVTFYGYVTDRDNDLCTYTWDFGDTNTDVSVQTEVNSMLSIEHTYMSEGLFLAYLTVTDQVVTVEVMDPVTIYVLPPANVPPEVDPLPEVHATVGVPQEFTATATDDDGDPLTYTWDFHDGTPLQVGNPVMHTYEVVSGEFGMLYTVYVDDGYGGTHNVSVNGIAFVVLPMVTLDLVVGWNLVTIPFADSDYTAGTVGLGNGDIIYGYNPTMGFYDTMFIVGVFPPEADFPLVPLVGYWVYANSPVTLELEGRVVAADRAIDVPTSGGWVLVGVPSGVDGVMASELVAMYSGSVDAVFAYNPALGFYDKFYVPGVPELDFVITPGMGLWMHCLSDGDLSYVP
jgi:hypothetical protein